jgi:hypothetical protein
MSIVARRIEEALVPGIGRPPERRFNSPAVTDDHDSTRILVVVSVVQREAASGWALCQLRACDVGHHENLRDTVTRLAVSGSARWLAV